MPNAEHDADNAKSDARVSAGMAWKVNDAEKGEEEDEEYDTIGELSSSNTLGSGGVGTTTVAGPMSESPTAIKDMTAAERREHSRKHSRVHSRNLSVFFPRPGSEAERESDLQRASDAFDARPNVQIDTNPSTLSPKGSASLAAKAFGHGLAPPTSPGETSVGSGLSPSRSRKGHHRKHSVMHDYRDDASMSRSEPRSRIEQHNDVFLSKADPTPFSQGPQHDQYRHLSTSQQASLSESGTLTVSDKGLMLFGLAQFFLGAILWLDGQSGDSLSMTGLGYLVVFDAFGILNSVAASWMTTRWKERVRSGSFARSTRSYGLHRVETLLHFTQTIYLLFAAIYVCKESVEHALLEGTEEDHEQDDIGLHLPQTTLMISTCACILSNVILHNHAKLVAACGLSTAVGDVGPLRRGSHARKTSVLVDPGTMAGPFLHLLANPFSLTILFFNVTLAVACLTMPDVQVAALDKILAGLQSVSMLYVAYPASKALGKILLQTAPKSHEVQSVQLLRSLRTIEGHRLVTYVAPPHLWQLTPPTSSVKGLFASSSSSSSSSRSDKFSNTSSLLLGQSINRTGKNATLIASVEIFVDDHASDADVLDVTRWSWQLLASSVGAGAGLEVGESLRGAVRAGEVTVQVCRDSERTKYRQMYSISSCEHQHEHAHDHKHEHGSEAQAMPHSDGHHHHHHGHHH